MLNFMRRIFGNGEKIAIGNKICIGLILFLVIVSIFRLWESRGNQDIELSKKNELSELKDNLSNLKADSEFNSIWKEIKALQIRLKEVNEKYEPYHTELDKRKKAETERKRKAEVLAKRAEFEKQLKMLDSYPSVEDIAIFFATPNLMKRELVGETVVMHGKVEGIIVNTLFMSAWFTADGDVHEATFLFENDSFNFTAQCRIEDYVLISGMCERITGKDSFLSGTMAAFQDARIHYNYGRLEQ